MAIIITHSFVSTKPDSGDTTVVNASNWNDDHVITGLPTKVFSETPSGTINGSNPTFTLLNAPITGSEQIYINGLRMKIVDDYTLSTNTITFVVAPVSGDRLMADYEY